MGSNLSDAVDIEDLISPIAWKPGELFAIVASCSRDDLKRISSAFMKSRLVMEQGERKLLEISSKLPSVCFQLRLSIYHRTYILNF